MFELRAGPVNPAPNTPYWPLIFTVSPLYLAGTEVRPKKGMWNRQKRQEVVAGYRALGAWCPPHSFSWFTEWWWVNVVVTPEDVLPGICPFFWRCDTVGTSLLGLSVNPAFPRQGPNVQLLSCLWSINADMWSEFTHPPNHHHGEFQSGNEWLEEGGSERNPSSWSRWLHSCQIPLWCGSALVDCGTRAVFSMPRGSGRSIPQAALWLGFRHCVWSLTLNSVSLTSTQFYNYFLFLLHQPELAAPIWKTHCLDCIIIWLSNNVSPKMYVKNWCCFIT